MNIYKIYKLVAPFLTNINLLYEFYLDILKNQSHPYIILILRENHRHILNKDEFMRASKRNGFTLIPVYFEQLTFREQIELIHCTDILIGVGGAAFSLSVFLKPGISFLAVFIIE